MKKRTENFYIDAIQSVYPESWFIRHPDIVGFVGKVYLVETPDGTVVCKFNDKDLIVRNYQVSQLLQTKNLSVPHTQIHAFADVFFESYKYHSGKTLYEHMQDDMTPSQIFDVYKQSMAIQSEISKIDPKKINIDWGKYAYETFVRCKEIRDSYAILRIFGIMHKILSTHGDLKLFHNDIQPKNILLDNNLNLSSIIDLDTVALCNESFSVLKTLFLYPLNNYSEYMDCYEDTVKRKLNRNAIMQGLKIAQQLRNIKHIVQKKR